MSRKDQDVTRDEGRGTWDDGDSNEITLSRREYDELKKQAQEGSQAHDQYLRTYAELENARKRFNKEKSELAKFATTELMLILLPIIDNFDRALDSLKEGDSKESAFLQNPVFAGVELIRKQFHDFLDQQGAKPIHAVGEKFDPHRHEALMEVETDQAEEGTIIEEIQKGYLLHDRLIRPAVVKVAKKPKEKEE